MCDYLDYKKCFPSHSSDKKAKHGLCDELPCKHLTLVMPSTESHMVPIDMVVTQTVAERSLITVV
jgi:hypothetical protein